jgi:flagellar L-ring protein precursor FlgH
VTGGCDMNNRTCIEGEQCPARPRHALPRPVALCAWALVLILLLAVGGCANMLRTVEVQQPMTARPPAPPAPVAGSGAIFLAANYQPLFEDRRARNVGDTLTININEKLNASKTATTNADRKGSAAFNLADVQFGGKPIIKGGAIKGDSDLSFKGGGDSGANNVFTGTITVTVIEVLPNGNLVVSGEKQIGINTGSEFVRLSGVVNPTTIIAGNVVSSIQVADARLEYRGTGSIDEAQTMGWLARTFQSVLPF